jgi:hypothetical protein
MLVLADRGDEQKVIEEERQEWLNEVLLALDVPVKAFELEIDEFRDYLNSVEIEIWQNADGTLDVYKDSEIVAQWKEPKLVLIKETPKKWYYEIHIDAWARPLQKLEV